MNVSKVFVLLVLSVAACKSSSATSDKGSDRSAAKDDKPGEQAVDKAEAKADYDREANQATDDLNKAADAKADYDREANQATDDLNKAEAGKADITPANPRKLVNTMADQMCSCTTAECGRRVMAANADNLKMMTSFKPASTEEGNAISAASKRMSDCAAKLPS